VRFFLRRAVLLLKWTQVPLGIIDNESRQALDVLLETLSETIGNLNLFDFPFTTTESGVEHPKKLVRYSAASHLLGFFCQYNLGIYPRVLLFVWRQPQNTSANAVLFTSNKRKVLVWLWDFIPLDVLTLNIWPAPNLSWRWLLINGFQVLVRPTSHVHVASTISSLSASLIHEAKQVGWILFRNLAIFCAGRRFQGTYSALHQGLTFSSLTHCVGGRWSNKSRPVPPQYQCATCNVNDLMEIELQSQKRCLREVDWNILLSFMRLSSPNNTTRVRPFFTATFSILIP